MISKELAQRNGLAVGDTIRGTVVDGMIGWQPGYNDVLIDFEIVGIYQIARSEPSSPQTPESELQENMIFTDIATAKELYQIKFPDRTAEQYNYTAGIFLFLNDPALMAQTAENLRAQPFANWDEFIITENDTRYQSAAAPIEKMTELCFYLLITGSRASLSLLGIGTRSNSSTLCGMENVHTRSSSASSRNTLVKTIVPDPVPPSVQEHLPP